MGRQSRVKPRSVMDQLERLELLERRVAYLEDRLRQWDWVDAQWRKVLGSKTPLGIDGDSLSSSAPMEHSRVTVSTPGQESCQGVNLGKNWNTLRTGHSPS